MKVVLLLSLLLLLLPLQVAALNGLISRIFGSILCIFSFGRICPASDDDDTTWDTQVDSALVVTLSLQDKINQAVARWREVIVADLPDIDTNRKAFSGGFLPGRIS